MSEKKTKIQTKASTRKIKKRKVLPKKKKIEFFSNTFLPSLSETKVFLDLFFTMLLSVATLIFSFLSYQWLKQKTSDNSSSTLYSGTNFIENKDLENDESDKWLDDCSHSEEILSEIELYFGRDIDKERSYLRFPDEEGSRIWNRNFIFYGKPGTGKSHCALLIAKNTSSHYAIIPGGTLQEIFVGSGARALKGIINDAKMHAENSRKPVFIIVEEIDSLAGAKNKDNWRSDDTLVNTFLEGVDSIRRDNLNIIIIGTTNVIELMDVAAVRNGRFNQLQFKYPDKNGLIKMLKKIKSEIEKMYNVVESSEKAPQLKKGNEIIINQDYWNTLKTDMLQKLEKLNRDNSYSVTSYPATFAQIISCVDKSIRITTRKFKADSENTLPVLGLVHARETSSLIAEICDKEQDILASHRKTYTPRKRISGVGL